MAEINNAIALQAAPPAYDPLATVGKISGVQAQLLQNKLLQQQYGSKISAGRALAGAIDPITGLPDQAKVGQYFVDHPDEAQYSPEGLAASQTLNSGQLTNEGQRLANARAQLGLSDEQGKVMSAAFLPFISKFSTPDPQTGKVPVPTRDDFRKALLGVVDYMGPAADQNVRNRAATLFQHVGDDPNAMVESAKNLALIGNPTSEGVGLLFGTPEKVDTGASIITRQVSPLSGTARPIGAPIQKQLDPASASELVDVVGPDGGHYKVPKASLLGGAAPGAAPPAAGGSGGDGRYPGAHAAPGGVPGAVGVAALPPGAPEAMADSYKTFQADQQAVPDLRKVLSTFDQAYAAIKKADTGPGSQWLQNLRGIASTYPNIPFSDKIASGDKAVAYAEANKWLTSALTQEASRLHLGTDQARALQQEAQPGVHTVHDAAVAMIPVLKGLKAMDVAAPLLAQKEGVTPQQYVQWRASWANSVDPLAFGADLMPAAQRKAMIDKMKPDQKARYVKGIKSAVNAGLFTYDDLR